MNIHHATDDFNFKQLHLANPSALQGGSFFVKLHYSDKDSPLYIYTPTCSTKGVVTSGNKQYMDLVFLPTNTNLLTWITSLEEQIQQLIYEKRDLWFTTDNLELDDIQSAFIPVLKYKNNQWITRAYIYQGIRHSQGNTLRVYNHDETPCLLQTITPNSSLINILEFQGIKFSKNSFQLMIYIRQIMVLENSPFNNCLIKPTKQNHESILEVNTGMFDDPSEILNIQLTNFKG
jgi:hypothetical protein